MRSRSSCGRFVRAAALAVALCSAQHAALAQHGGGGGMPGGMGGGMGGGMAGRGGGFDRGHDNRPPSNAPDSAGTSSTMRPGLQLGPPGRWWDDKHFAKQLQLRPDQQRRMDAAFESNRAGLLRRFEDLQGEQNRMEALVRARNLDESALFSQIDRIAQARAELEKANTHLLLQIRGEMDTDQITRLEQHR